MIMPRLLALVRVRVGALAGRRTVRADAVLVAMLGDHDTRRESASPGTSQKTNVTLRHVEAACGRLLFGRDRTGATFRTREAHLLARKQRHLLLAIVHQGRTCADLDHQLY